MTPREFLEIRIQNGKLCDSLDERYINQFGDNMKSFWMNTNSQKDLLWSLRGLGKDDTADFIWKLLSIEHNLKLHCTVISKEDAQQYANEIRMSYGCPLEFRECIYD